MIFNILSDHTVRIVTIACSILGMISGVVGCFAVLKKQSLIGDAISHTSLAGVAIVFIITRSKNLSLLLLGAFIIGIISVYLIQIIKDQTKVKFDSAIALMLSVFFGFGLVLLTYIKKLPGANRAGLNKFIFGQASTLLKNDIYVITSVSIILLIISILLWKEIKISIFDPNYAKSLGFKVSIIDLIILLMIVITIVIGIQTAGVILIISMLIAPAVAARQWTDSLAIMVILSAVFGSISGAVGTVISSFYDNIPTGPVIVVSLSVFVIISLLIAPNRGIIFRLIKNKKRNLKIIEKLSKEGEK